MKKTIIFLLLFFFALSLLSLFAQQEPTVKFYLIDGNFRQYNITDIENLEFIHSNQSYQMIVFRNNGALQTQYDIREIDTIWFPTNKMKISFNDTIIEQNLFEIDSLIFEWNTCEEIQIGDQIWMCKNLDVDHYRNGDPIPEITDSIEWANLKTGAWCYYNNNIHNGDNYGKLYNWYAIIDPRGLCPEGWHVPTDDEWKTLEMYIGMSKENADKNGFRGINEGGKLKESGTAHWQIPNAGGTNESVFTALPGGARDDYGTFNLIGLNGFWWSATIDTTSPYWLPPRAWLRRLDNIRACIIRAQGNYLTGISIRCIKD